MLIEAVGKREAVTVFKSACLVSFSGAILILSLGCKPKTAMSGSSGGEVPTQSGRVTSCELITAGEFEQIQDSHLQEGRKSSGVSGNVVFDQCYFAADDLAKSVTIAVARPMGGKGGKNPRDVWMEKFGRYSRDEKAAEGEREESEEGEEHESSPRKVSGTGEQAFWSGTSVGGALYVLQGNIFLRISVGGAESQEAKLEKSRRFAQIAVRRLSGEG